MTLDQAQRLWKGEAVPEADPDDTRELLNYRSAFAFVSECLDSGDPITEGMIREIHRKLVEGVRGGKADPGNYRRIQNYVANSKTFLDGNGRTSRLLSTLCLYKAGYDFKRLFTISEYYDRDRPAFYRKIQSVRENGMDMTGWLDYFITGLETHHKELCPEVNRRSLQRDLKAFLEKGLIKETGAGPTDPTRYYVLS